MKKKGYIFIGVIVMLFLIVTVGGQLLQDTALDALVKTIPDDVNKVLDQVLESCHEGDAESLDKLLIDEIKANSGYKEQIKLVFEHTKGYLNETEIVGYYYNITNGNKFDKLTYQYKKGDQNYLLNVWVYRNNMTVSTLTYRQVEKYPNTLNTIVSSSIIEKLMILIGLCIVGFSIYTAGYAFSSKIKHRWFWSLISLCGVVVIWWNSHTGNLSFEITTLKFPVALIRSNSDYSPVMGYLALPIFSILFWFQYKKQKSIEYIAKQFLFWFKRQYGVIYNFDRIVFDFKVYDDYVEATQEVSPLLKPKKKKPFTYMMNIDEKVSENIREIFSDYYFYKLLDVKEADVTISQEGLTITVEKSRGE